MRVKMQPENGGALMAKLISADLHSFVHAVFYPVKWGVYFEAFKRKIWVFPKYIETKEAQIWKPDVAHSSRENMHVI